MRTGISEELDKVDTCMMHWTPVFAHVLDVARSQHFELAPGDAVLVGPALPPFDPVPPVPVWLIDAVEQDAVGLEHH